MLLTIFLPKMTKQKMMVAHELEDLKDIDIITFDIILLSAYVYYAKKR